MPLPSSPHLALTRPAGSDPFQRQTIVDDLDILDQYPGIFICASTARPSWGPAQAGMFIGETDTGRIIRWTGSAWAVPEHYGKVAWGSLNIATDLSKGASPSAYVVYNDLTVVRTCTLFVVMTVRTQKSAVSPQQITLDPWIDGTSCNFGPTTNSIYYPDGPSGTTRTSAQISTILGARTGVTPGTHDIQLKVTVGNTDNNDITLSWAKAAIFFSE